MTDKLFVKLLINTIQIQEFGPVKVQQHRLRIFENRMPRRIFGPKRYEIKRDWRRVHNEKLHNFKSSSNSAKMIKSRRMRWARRVARIQTKRSLYNVLVGKSTRKMDVDRVTIKWNIKQ
jgi:uncharacterized membrane protein